MDFTPLVASGSIPSAACDLYIASVVLPSRIIIRSTKSLSIKRVINLEPNYIKAVMYLSWATRPRDQHRLLLAADASTIKAFDMADDQWDATIYEGLGGIKMVEWSKGGEDILVWSEFSLKMTVWSTTYGHGTIVANPKFAGKGYSYRPGTNHFALLQRTSNDRIVILERHSSGWKTIKTFAIDCDDAQGLVWSPNGLWLAIWDGIARFSLRIYSADGRLVKTYSPYETGLGIKTVKWSPDGEYLAIGSFDGKVRLLNNLTFSSSIELSHSCILKCQEAVCWRELPYGSNRVKYEKMLSQFSIPTVKSTTNDLNPKIGIGTLIFNPNGDLLVTRDDSMPTSLWIWSLREMSPIAVLIHCHPVRSVKWHPLEAGLLIIICQKSSQSDYSNIYLWDIQWTEPQIIIVPRENFDARLFEFIESPVSHETGVLFESVDSFTIGYPVLDASSMNTIIQEEDEPCMSPACE